MKHFMRSMRAYAGVIGALAKVFINLLYGLWKIAKLKRAPVTVFGGARLKSESKYMKSASQLAQMLARAGIPVLTGGGPGIMEAASCGALLKNGAVITTIGISVKGLDAVTEHPECHRNLIEMDNFGSRKWLLIHYSRGFAVFPGGFGTLNELTELLTLIQTKMNPAAPIVLIGVDYWKPFMVWLRESALKEGLIAKEDVDLFSITDDIAAAFELLKAAAKGQPFKLF